MSPKSATKNVYDMSLKMLESGQRHKKKLHSGAKTYNNKKTLEIDRNLQKKI